MANERAIATKNALFLIASAALLFLETPLYKGVEIIQSVMISALTDGKIHTKLVLLAYIVIIAAFNC